MIFFVAIADDDKGWPFGARLALFIGLLLIIGLGAGLTGKGGK